MFFHLLLAMLSVFMMIAVGFAARHRGWIEAETAAHLSRLTLKLFYPALIFSSLVQRFDRASLVASWSLPVGALMIACIGFGTGAILARGIRFSGPRERGAFRLQCTMNNYSFLPMPLLLMLRGDEAVAALIFSALGSEIACWTLGIMALTGGGFNRPALRRLINVPMLTVMLALLVVWLRETSGGVWVSEIGGGWIADLGAAGVRGIDLFGRATIPLAMMVAGCRMADLRISHLASVPQGVLLAARLLVIPALAVGLLNVLPLETSVREVLTVVAVMPCAVTSVVLAQAYGGDSEFAASSVFTTQVLSLLTVPLWLALTIA